MVLLQINNLIIIDSKYIIQVQLFMHYAVTYVYIYTYIIFILNNIYIYFYVSYNF